MAHPLIFHNLLCEGPQTLIFVATPPLNIPKVVVCIVIVVVVVSVFVVLTQCICVCVELKCYSGASRSNWGGNELGGGGGGEGGGGGGGGGLFQSGLLCPYKLNFMCVCVCVCTPVNLCIINYKFIFMICIHL